VKWTTKQILGIPIIEEAAPGGFPAQQERELYSQIQAAIDMLRCPSCGSLNYQTTLFVFAASVEKMVECRTCGNVHQEILYNDVRGLLGFLPSRVASSHDLSE
jgi:ribosomal protein L32